MQPPLMLLVCLLAASCLRNAAVMLWHSLAALWPAWHLLLHGHAQHFGALWRAEAARLERSWWQEQRI